MMKKLIIIKMKFIAHLSRKLKGKKATKFNIFVQFLFRFFHPFDFYSLIEDLWNLKSYDLTFSLYPSVHSHLFIYSRTGPGHICKIQFSNFTIRKKSKRYIFDVCWWFCVKLEGKYQQILFLWNIFKNFDYCIVDL